MQAYVVEEPSGDFRKIGLPHPGICGALATQLTYDQHPAFCAAEKSWMRNISD